MRIHELVLLALSMSTCLAPLSAQAPPTIQQSQIVGSVYGKTITAADIGLTDPIDPTIEFDARDTDRWKLMGRIAQAFGKTISDRFIQEKNIVATEEEIAEYRKMWRVRRQNQLDKTEKKLEKVKTRLASANLSSEARTKLEKEHSMLEFLLPRLRDAAISDVPEELARQQIVSRKFERELHRTYGGKVIFQQAGPEALDARRLLYEEAEKNGDLKFDDAGVRHMFYYYSKMDHVAVDENVLEHSPLARTPQPAKVPIQPKVLQKENHPKAVPEEKTWVLLESSSAPMELAPRQIVPVESGLWFGGSQRGSGSSPLGFMDLNEGHVTLLLENGSTNWDAVGTEAIAVQLDRKSLVRLSVVDQSVATWERPKNCKYFTQVRSYAQRFCISSPYNPVWVFDPWLDTWQKIELEPVTDSDSERLGPNYYRPSMKRFVIGPGGSLWGFQGTHDATRGNAVCHYVPEQANWEHYGFPWAMARGDDHWPLGATDTAVFFAGQQGDLLLFDRESHRWSTSEITWPQGSFHAAKFTQHGVLIPVGNSVKRLTSDFSEWESVANLSDDDRITAIAVSGDSLYLATASGIHVLDKVDSNRFGEPEFHPWKFAEEAKTYKAVFGLASSDHAIVLADKLCKAATEGDLERVRNLLSVGADIEATTDPAGSTPLLLACSNCHIRVAELLIENGANIHARNTSGQNALTMAARGKHRELADYLMSKGVKR